MDIFQEEANLADDCFAGNTRASKALVLCSGGVDSSTLLALAVAVHGADNVTALSIQYGQKHEKEIESARAVAAHYGVEQRFLDLSVIFEDSDCSLLAHSDEQVPHESYAEQLQETDGSPVSTYVPFRNGAHADDAAGNAYPDCSPAFIADMDAAVREGTAGELHIEAPFQHWNKAKIVRAGLRLNVPYEKTWSCYEGGDEPCGVCGTCRDRIRAFQENGTVDPLMRHRDDNK